MLINAKRVGVKISFTHEITMKIIIESLQLTNDQLNAIICIHQSVMKLNSLNALFCSLEVKYFNTSPHLLLAPQSSQLAPYFEKLYKCKTAFKEYSHTHSDTKPGAVFGLSALSWLS